MEASSFINFLKLFFKIDIPDKNFEVSYQQLVLTVQILNESFELMTNINTSDVGSWEKFHSEFYAWLPIRPTRLAINWHKDFQIYVAVFTRLYNTQLSYYTDETSHELKELREYARESLCQIELFAASIAKRNIAGNLYWYDKREMDSKIKFEEGQNFLNNLFVKARFEQYVNRMLKRVENFNLGVNLKKMGFNAPKYRKCYGKHSINIRSRKGRRARRNCRKLHRRVSGREKL